MFLVEILLKWNIVYLMIKWITTMYKDQCQLLTAAWSTGGKGSITYDNKGKDEKV